MSIATRTGDEGMTSLMYGRRVPKTDPRVCAYGTVDELSAAIGMARATATDTFVGDALFKTQKELVGLMGELACHPDDFERYEKGGYPKINEEMLLRLDDLVKKVEDGGIKWEGWATPGANLHAASVDMARTICRRAEREIISLSDYRSPVRPVIIKYMNRLSDLLWLLARLEETRLQNPETQTGSQ